MKKKLSKTLALVGLVISLQACSSLQNSEQSNDYFGYNNNPKEKETTITVAEDPQRNYNNNDEDSRQYYDNASSYGSNSNIGAYNSEVQYIYVNPVVHSAYYPWWSRPSRFRVVNYYTPSYSFYMGYGNYDPWYNSYYPNYYDYYGNSMYYYPYPVYQDYYYPHYYGSGWYPRPHSNDNDEPRKKDTYRDFGPNRGGYGSISDDPAAGSGNIRSGASTPTPAGTIDTRPNAGSKTPNGTNTRSGQEPVKAPEGNNIWRRSGVTPESPNSGQENTNTQTPTRTYEEPQNRRSPREDNYTSPSNTNDKPNNTYTAPRRSEPAPQRESTPSRSYEAPRRDTPSAPKSSPSREPAKSNKNNESSPNKRSR